MIPLLIVGAVVLFAVTGILGHGQKRLDKHGIHALAWRFLTGHPWHGTAITDAGWLRKGACRVDPHRVRAAVPFPAPLAADLMRSGEHACFHSHCLRPGSKYPR